MTASSRFREAFKIALALAVAYGVSLWLDWNNVHWAGIAIAMCALSTSGEALRKGILRVAGTLLGAVVALTIMSFAFQDRWLYVLITTLWVGFCTWMSIDNPKGYLWLMAGFIVPLMTIMSGSESQQAFQVAILRMQQTGLGVFVYTLVATFVFPTPSREAFEREVTQQSKTIYTLYVDACQGMPGLEGRETEPAAEDVRRTAAQRQKKLVPNLAAAALESFEVADVQRQWRSLIEDLAVFYATLERWRLGLRDLPPACARDGLTGYDTFCAEIDRRLCALLAILAGGDAEHAVRPTGLKLDESLELPAFDRAALLTSYHHMAEIDWLSARMLATVADIRDLPPARDQSTISAARGGETPKLWLPDAERVASTVFAMTSFLLFCLTYIYVPSLPAPPLMFGMGTALALVLAATPFVPLYGIARASAFGLLFGGLFHLLVMPNLEGFPALGTWLFAAAFAICWIWHGPAGALQRSMGIAFLVAVSAIDNQQTYSFTGVVNFGVQLLITFAIFAIALSAPVSFKHEIVFRRLVRRYFSSLNALVHTVHVERRHARSWWERQRRAYHLLQVRTIPTRLLPWLMFMPATAIAPEDKVKLQGFVQSLAVLNIKIEDLLVARDLSYTDDTLTHMLPELRAWREAIQTVSEGLAAGREELLGTDYQGRLNVRMTRLEDLIREVISAGTPGSEGLTRDQSLFRLLGAFRGASEALLGVIERAITIDWPRFREARF